MNRSSKDTEFLPLLGALKKIQFWLESDHAPHVMLAASTLDEFKSQKLPPQCRVTRRKLRGPRVPVRGHQQIRRAQGTLAYWPEDGVLEAVSPSLAFVLNGKADLRLADYVVHSQTGDILFIPPRIPKYDVVRPHYEKITPEAHCDILMFRADVASTQIVKAHICHSRGDQHVSGGDGECCMVKGNLLYQIFAGLGDELQNQGQQKSIRYLLCGFLFLFQQELERGRAFNSKQYPAKSSLSHSQGPIREAMDQMQNHLDKPLSIEQVARWVGLSRTAFTVQFREETNESFKEYLTRLRMEHAKVLLSQSNLPIDRVSERIGLTPGQLRNIFHREYHCTPKEFRYSQKDVQD